MDQFCDKRLLELGFDVETQFLYAYSSLDYVYKYLCQKYDSSHLIDSKAFLLRYIHNILEIQQSLHMLYTEKRDARSLLTLTRALVESIALLNLFYIETSTEEERRVRFILYYLDGISTRIKLSDYSDIKYDPNIATQEEYDYLMLQCSNTLKTDIVAKDNLSDMLKSSPLYANINAHILKDNNWKYRDLSDKSSYTYLDLFAKVYSSSLSGFNQNYLSQYVHGLAIMDIQASSLNFQSMPICLTEGIEVMKILRKIMDSVFCNDVAQMVTIRKQVLQELYTDCVPQAKIEEWLANS